MIKKKLIDLNETDLLNIPVWEHRTEDNIEYVIPTDQIEIIDDGMRGFIVLTEFIFNNKSSHWGFCSPQDPSGLDYIQPVIFSKHGQVEIYRECEWDQEEILEAIEKLGYSFQEIFPIQYTSKIPCEGKFYSGTIINFNEDNRRRRLT